MPTSYSNLDLTKILVDGGFGKVFDGSEDVMNVGIYFLLVIMLVVSMTLLELIRAIKKTLSLISHIITAYSVEA